MSSVFEAPKDSFGFPLPIIPSEDFPDDIHSDRLSKHHEFFLYGSKKFHTLGEIAARGSRILRAEKVVHNTGPKSFHRFFNQSPAPETMDKQFMISLLSASGYLPEQGIDLWAGEPSIRDMEAGEREILQSPDLKGGLRYKNMIYYNEDLRAFYDKYLVKQDLTQLPDELLASFKAATKSKVVKEVGHEVIESVVALASTPITSVYTEARERGQLHPLAPESPEPIVLRILGSEEQRERLLGPLKGNLARIALQTGVDEVQLAA